MQKMENKCKKEQKRKKRKFLKIWFRLKFRERKG